MDDHALFDELMKIHKNNRNFDLLAGDFKAGRIVPFIGAGFSRPQFPLWENFLKENSEIYGIADEINKEIRIGNMEKAASLLEHKMGTLRV